MTSNTTVAENIVLDKESPQSTVILDNYKTNGNIYIDYIKFGLCILIIVGLLYHMYNTFYENQLNEPGVEKSIKSNISPNTPSDENIVDNFDIMNEICNIKRKQEEYLNKLKD